MTIREKLEHAKKYWYPVIIEHGQAKDAPPEPVMVAEIEPEGPHVTSPDKDGDNHGCGSFIRLSAIQDVYPAPERESILDEEWEHYSHTVINCKATEKGSGTVTSINPWAWKPEIAALPRAFRALVGVKNQGDTTYGGFLVSEKVMEEVNAVLKQAEIVQADAKIS